MRSLDRWRHARDSAGPRTPRVRVGLLRGGIILLVGLAIQASAVLTEVGPTPATPEPSSQAVVETYLKQVQPILVEKCAACHTATTERPLHYYIPILSYWTQPFIDDHIRRGRVQFDFSGGFPTGRVGAAHEFIARLRDSVLARDMPPMEYTLVHWTHRLSEAERKTILDWAASGIELLNAVRSSRENEPEDAPDIPEKIAAAIAEACPLADPKDTAARDACGEKLAQSEILKTRMREPFLWGGQKTAGDYELENFASNRFNPLAWRKMYLSLFMFDRNFRVERVGGQTILHMPARFRGELDAGEYPYPFWHSEKKWNAYNYSTEVILVYRDGKLKGAVRSAVFDTSRSKAAKTWDQKWHWFTPGAGHEADQPQPRVTLYSSLFTPENPHVKELDAAYRKLALGFAQFKCFECHTPSNDAKMNMLEFFNYPNQALAGRNRVITVLGENSMPPIDGIQSSRDRQTMLELARDFKRIADEALAFESEKLEDSLIGPLERAAAAP
jgi:heme-binding protein